MATNGREFATAKHRATHPDFKYMNDLLPTAKRLQTIDNMMEDVSNANNFGKTPITYSNVPVKTEATKKEAMQIFCAHLNAKHTPTVMTDLICNSMENWIHRHRISLPTWAQTEPFLTALTAAFNSQKQIGWDQFFRG